MRNRGHASKATRPPLYLFDQDEAFRSAGEGGERSRERAREAGPLRREEGWAPEGDSGYPRTRLLGQQERGTREAERERSWAPEEGDSQQVLEGLQK